jgi:hypothetical protein
VGEPLCCQVNQGFGRFGELLHYRDGGYNDRFYPSISFNPSSNNIRTLVTFWRSVFAANIDNLRCTDSDISTLNLTVASLSGAWSLLIRLGSFDLVSTQGGFIVAGVIDISQKEMVERALLNYNGILPEKT